MKHQGKMTILAFYVLLLSACHEVCLFLAASYTGHVHTKGIPPQEAAS